MQLHGLVESGPTLKQRLEQLSKVTHAVPCCPSCDDPMLINAAPTVSYVARCNNCEEEWSIDHLIKLNLGMAILVKMVTAVIDAIPTDKTNSDISRLIDKV